MRARWSAAAVILLWAATPVFAHRLDEYLQAATISLEKARVQGQLRLTPGVAVFPAVRARIDTNGDGIISSAEQRDYADRVLRDLSLTVDGRRLRLRLVSWKFASEAEMKAGLGEIDIAFTADIPRSGGNRRLLFTNHHQSRIAAYMVNCLVPADPDIRITAQNRSCQQSFYQVDYVQADSARPRALSWSRNSIVWEWVAAIVFLLLAPFVVQWRLVSTAMGKRIAESGASECSTSGDAGVWNQ